VIRVGLTERHGMAKEFSEFPPSGVEYRFLDSRPKRVALVGSPIKGFLGHYEADGVDVIEAILSPIVTRSRWIYSPGNFIEATAFNLKGLPLPRHLRVAYLRHLMTRSTFQHLVFWSEAGRATLESYGGVDEARLGAPVSVVYPAVRDVADEPDRSDRPRTSPVSILFSGDFFRKGGVHVVDAIERLHRDGADVTLVVCCDPAGDFNTTDAALRGAYLDKVRTHPAIQLRGRIPRQDMLMLLRSIDIFAMPTYVEVFGMAILEAMAFGIPVISTNYFAIPEMVVEGKNGFLIDTRPFDPDRLFRGYVVREIPREFRAYMTERVFAHLSTLIQSADLRRSMGAEGKRLARSKFSFAARHAAMLPIYRAAVG
jgi:glycosyltransferase involved in cell wall biosynthesis